MAQQFESPRFAGDPLLEEILNDPDTGTKKLGPGSPADSVMRLQKALFDLTWNEEIQPPVVDEGDFVVGNYGPRTTEAVLAFKRQYDIHFPPSAPTGFIDGFAGPRTFAKLDPQCVLLDEAIVAIQDKAAELNAARIATELIGTSRRGTVRIKGTSGTFTAAEIAGASGAVYFKRGLGAFEVHGNIHDAYLAADFAAGPFGFPTSDEHDDGAGFRASDFETGTLRCELATGVVTPIGPTPSADGEAPVF
jgi:hypothetical protein